MAPWHLHARFGVESYFLCKPQGGVRVLQLRWRQCWGRLARLGTGHDATRRSL
jgi:hypothetical protein